MTSISRVDEEASQCWRQVIDEQNIQIISSCRRVEYGIISSWMVCCGRGKCFFDGVTILIHQCNNTNIAYQQFYSCLR